jgi:tetratricopeptide (TPR) repeat protein
MILLGQPKVITANHLKVLQMGYLFAALVATLVSVIILAGLVVHYWSLPADEVKRRLGRIEKVTEETGQKVDLLLNQIDHKRNELQQRLDEESSRKFQLATDISELRVEAVVLAQRNPEIMRLADELKGMVNKLKAELGPGQLSKVDDLRLRLAEATVANAERRYGDTLELVTEKDVTKADASAQAGIDQAVKAHQVRADAFYGLHNWEQALAHYERILQYRPDSWSAALNVGDCLFFLGNLSDALLRFR